MVDAVRDKDHPYAKMYRDMNPGGKVHKPPMPSVEECQSVEETIAKIEAMPSNQKLLRQIGVRESLFRVSRRRIRSSPYASAFQSSCDRLKLLIRKRPPLAVPGCKNTL